MCFNAFVIELKRIWIMLMGVIINTTGVVLSAMWCIDDWLLAHCTRALFHGHFNNVNKYC